MSKVVLIPGSVFDGNYTPKWVNFGWSSTAQQRFPQRIKISTRAVGWVEEEVREWLATRVQLSRACLHEQDN